MGYGNKSGKKGAELMWNNKFDMKIEKQMVMKVYEIQKNGLK